MAEVRARGIVKICEQIRELLAIAQRQADREFHAVIGAEPAFRLKAPGNLGHVALEDLRWLGCGCVGGGSRKSAQKQNCNQGLKFDHPCKTRLPCGKKTMQAESTNERTRAHYSIVGAKREWFNQICLLRCDFSRS